MNDEELDELLRLVDEPTEHVPVAFEQSLWDELSATFCTTMSPNPAAPDARTAVADLVELTPIDDASTAQGRRMRWGSVAAAVAAVAAAGVIWLHGGSAPDGATELTTSPSPEVADQPATDTTDDTTPPTLADPVEACERFRTGAALLVDLPDAVAALETATSADGIQAAVDDIEGVRLALRTYAAHLQAGDYIDEAEARRLTNVSRTLQQALTEIGNGDLEAASRTVGAARNATNSLLQTLDLPSLQYDAFGPTIDCVE